MASNDPWIVHNDPQQDVSPNQQQPEVQTQEAANDALPPIMQQVQQHIADESDNQSAEFEVGSDVISFLQLPIATGR